MVFRTLPANTNGSFPVHVRFMISDSEPGGPRTPDSADAIVGRLSGAGPAIVALSGGVDSSVVALLAHRALGPKALAITLTGPAVSSAEVEAATLVARKIGLSHLLLRSDPLTDPGYAENPTNRCYYCRAHEGALLLDWGSRHGYVAYLDGVHLDDLGEDRPGLRAMDEHGFRHPLVEGAWGKQEVRSFARTTGLPNWDRPSNACLASRIVHGQAITHSVLEQVARAEEWVSARGYRRVRVRVSGRHARVEVDADEVSDLEAESDALRDELLKLGFVSVEVDPTGYRRRPGA